MVPKSFSFEAVMTWTPEGQDPASISLNYAGGDINTLFGERDRVCRSRLLNKYYQSVADDEPCLIRRSDYAQPTLPPPYPYPRVGYGNGYRYPDYVEFNADQTKLVVRYLASPSSEEIAWPTTVPTLLVSRTGSPQVETIAPESWAGQTIYARLELINGVKTITNFLPTYLGSGAILYPNAPNDPALSDTTIPRLFSSKAAFNATTNIAHNGSNDMPCSGCGLCDFEYINLPDNKFGFGGLSGVNPFMVFNYWPDSSGSQPPDGYNPSEFLTHVNLNSNSRACVGGSHSGCVSITLALDANDPWASVLNFYFDDLKLGTNTSVDATATQYGTISISLA